MPQNAPFRAEEQTLPMRRLTDAELATLGYEGPLQLAQLQFGRFGYWRKSKWYCVETPDRERLMTVTKKELAAYGIEP